mgnify:CR=1 FL=1
MFEEAKVFIMGSIQMELVELKLALVLELGLE